MFSDFIEGEIRRRLRIVEEDRRDMQYSDFREGFNAGERAALESLLRFLKES